MWTRPSPLSWVRTERAPPRAVWGAARSYASDVMPGHRRAIFLARGCLHLSYRRTLVWSSPPLSLGRF